MLLALILLPLIELWGLIIVGGAVGAFTTVLWVAFSVLLGAAMVRSAGLIALRQFAEAQAPQAAAAPADILSAAMVLVGGVALIIPGVFTDMFGLLCLWPAARPTLARLVLRRSEVYTFLGGPGSRPRPPGSPPGASRTIDAEWRDDKDRG